MLERAEFSDPKLFLRCSEQLLSALRNCFDQQIFLLPLADKFFKLALQIISRLFNAQDPDSLDPQHFGFLDRDPDSQKFADPRSRKLTKY